MIDQGSGDEFLASAEQALRSTDGPTALATLGWWDLLDELADPDARAGVFALFRAQGRVLADTVALGGLLAHPYSVDTGVASGPAVATVLRHSSRRGPVQVVVGRPEGHALLVDTPGEGAVVVDPGRCEQVAVDVSGRLAIHEVVVDASSVLARIDEPVAAGARERSRLLGRVALACEMLGSAETAVALAVDYAGDRRQFDQPIGSFQAVRHLLSWAQTDCVAVDAMIRETLRLEPDAPPLFGAVTKALAGRNCARACQRALQVFGGIGFTAEHDHHHYASRVMALDALLGSAAELRHELGRGLRTSGEDPRIAATVLSGLGDQSS